MTQMLAPLTHDERMSSKRQKYMAAEYAYGQALSYPEVLRRWWQLPGNSSGGPLDGGARAPFQFCCLDGYDSSTEEEHQARERNGDFGCLTQVRSNNALAARPDWTAQIQEDERIPCDIDELISMVRHGEYERFADTWNHLCEVQYRMGLGLDVVAGPTVP